MERLWTPWRRAFVEGTSSAGSDECFLCVKPAAHDDRPNLILFRGERAFALLNAFPYNSGHLMVAPYAHTADLIALDSPTADELMRITQRSLAALKQAYRPDAFNVGMNLGKSAGAGVPDHLHMHVVPRWEGDTSFMTVIGQTKVLPETLEQTYDRLEPFFGT